MSKQYFQPQYPIFPISYLLRMGRHPNGFIFKNLFLPDGHVFLKRIYQKPTCFKTFRAVRRGNAYDHYRFLNLFYTNGMANDHFVQLPFFSRLIRNLFHFFQGHGFIGFEFQGNDFLIVRKLTNGTDENTIAPLNGYESSLWTFAKSKSFTISNTGASIILRLQVELSLSHHLFSKQHHHSRIHC